MKFIITDEKDIDREIILDTIEQYKYIMEYEIVSLKNLDRYSDEKLIPIGSIQYVEKFLKNTFNIENENPIEIPEYLRTDEFLKRDYRIVTWDKIPRHGKFFLKDVSRLKKFGEVIHAEYFGLDEVFNYVPQGKYDNTLVLSKKHLYQVSETVNIISEYRVYVLGGRIYNVSCYNGDCMMFPDMKLVEKAVNLINYNEKWLKSYTIDVAVTHKGTCLLEVHNFTSVGLYNTLWGIDLPYAYRDGIDYLVNDNKKIKI